jgi:hypothetical protein
MISLSKTLILLFIILSYANYIHASTSKTREFLTSYFGVIYGKEWILNEDCFGGEFDIYIDKMHDAISKGNPSQAVLYLDKIVSLELVTCPLDQSSLIFKDLNTSIRNGTFLKNAIKHHISIKEKVEDFMKTDKRLKEMGICLGFITKMLVYGSSYSTYVLI